MGYALATMSIHIRRHHKLSTEQARQVAEELVQDLAERFSVDHHWEDTVLHFERGGVDGQIRIEDQAIDIQAQLGFLLSYLQPAIEREIHRYLDQHFDTA